MPIVVKYGGNAMTEPAMRRSVAAAIRASAHEGQEPVVVHGGGPFIEAELAREGFAARFVRGLRVTPPETLPAIERSLTLVGKRLAQEIGGALGLSGRDAGLLLAEPFDPELGRVGRVVGVGADGLRRLLRAGFVPVLACLAVDTEGEPLNVNGDEAAGAVAGALESPVIFLTNVPGVLVDPDDPDSLVPRLDRTEVERLILDGIISGGMIPKVESALAALDRGASSAIIADGRTADGLRGALRGIGGTKIVATRR